MARDAAHTPPPRPVTPSPEARIPHPHGVRSGRAPVPSFRPTLPLTPPPLPSLLPFSQVSKNKGGLCYSSSTVRQGQQIAIVAKTGCHTFIGRAATLIANTNEMGHFQKVIGLIGNFLVFITLALVIIIFIVGIVAQGELRKESPL